MRSQITQLSTANFCPQRGGYHGDTVDHLLDVCPAWNELWDWIRSTLRRARINAHDDMDDGDTAHHRDSLLFGHGFACTTPVEHEIQGAVWEVALTTNGLLTDLRVDATDFNTAGDACTRATTVLRRLDQVDYHAATNYHAATTHSGHPDRP